MIQIIPNTELKKWNSIIKSFPNWDVYYLCEYAVSLMLHGDGTPYLIYHDDGELRIAYVLMVSDIADFEPLSGHLEKQRCFDCETPYGYGGPLYDGKIDSDGINDFIKELTAYAQSHNIVSQFIRFHPILKNYAPVEKICNISHMKKTIYMDTSSPKIICDNLDRKNRNIIRKAVKNNVTVEWDKGDRIDAFLTLYNQTMDRNNADDYYYFSRTYFDYLIQNMGDNIVVFYGIYNDEIISSSIFFYNDKQMHYHLSGSLERYRSLGATNYIIYEAAIWANQRGIETLHLGGGVGIEDSLLGFKKQFNKNGYVEFCIGGNIFMPELASKFVELRKNVDSTFDSTKPYVIKYRGP